ncbi:MAG: TonB family protein [Acidobacteria bacterium]|nr:TonB family protein [Acidobacteriota bacterium]MBV9184726.1 TonB family protein [Acidobacteriota bacterium]
MDDRIGDLLAERAHLGGNPAGGIAVSVLLHGALAAGIIYAALHAAAPQEVSTLNIKFVAPSVGSRESGVVAPTPDSRLPTPEKKLTIPEPVAEAPKPLVKSEPKTVPLSNFGRSTKKGSETPPAPHVQPPTPQIATKPGVAGGIDIPIGSAGVTGIEGDFPYTIYVDRMKTLIGQRWLRPQVGTGITTTVSFTIDRDGTIRDAKNEILSGNGTFDRAALRAVLEASPLPPLPFGYNGTFLGVHLTFR